MKRWLRRRWWAITLVLVYLGLTFWFYYSPRLMPCACGCHAPVQILCNSPVCKCHCPDRLPRSL